MINDKIRLRYDSLLKIYGSIIGKKEYSQIFKISVSTINKYIAMGGINLAPFKKHKVKNVSLESRDEKPKHNNCRVYWDILDIAIELERNSTKRI